MKKNEKQLLLSILGIQSYSYNTSRMEQFILGYIDSLGLTAIYDEGNIYVTKGVSDSYPCIVSHTDTVHKIIPDSDYTIIANDEFAIGYDRAKMAATGCGGDDKVGIFICLQLLQEYDAIKVAFFVDEEVGCIGSYNANLDFFNDTRFILQCDRRGNADFVNSIYGTPLQSKRFKKAVAPILKQHGYKPTTGMLTDVYALKQSGVNVSVANMSCGYYNPHCDDETIVMADVTNCLEMCRQIFTNLTEVYNHTAPAERGYGGYNNSYSGYNNGYSGYSSRRDYDLYDDWDEWGTWNRGGLLTDTSSANTSSKDKKDIDFYDSHEQCMSCNEWKSYNEVEFSKDFNCFLCESCTMELV